MNKPNKSKKRLLGIGVFALIIFYTCLYLFLGERYSAKTITGTDNYRVFPHRIGGIVFWPAACVEEALIRSTHGIFALSIQSQGLYLQTPQDNFLFGDESFGGEASRDFVDSRYLPMGQGKYTTLSSSRVSEAVASYCERTATPHRAKIPSLPHQF